MMISGMRGAGIIVMVIVTVAGFAVAAGCVDRTFDRSADGSVVQAVPGETVTITLAENPSTGFIWNATVTGDLAITGDDYSSGNPVGEMMGMVGGGGSRSWQLTVGKDREQTFSAVLRRPWEPVNRTLDTYSITFVVP
jgi:predicted secreted protein